MEKNKDKPVIIYGSRTLARMLYFDARNHPAFTIAGFAVDAGFLAEDCQFLGLPQVAFAVAQEQFPPEHYDLIALHAGTDAMRDRAQFYHRARSSGYLLRNYISPGCDLAPDLHSGDNNVIMAQSHIGIDGVMGSNNLIRQQVYLGHGFVLGDHNVITSGCKIGGNSHIGDLCYLGLGSVILNRITIADETLVGAGCVVIRSTEPATTVVGNPGRVVGHHEAEGIRLNV